MGAEGAERAWVEMGTVWGAEKAWVEVEWRAWAAEGAERVWAAEGLGRAWRLRLWSVVRAWAMAATGRAPPCVLAAAWAAAVAARWQLHHPLSSCRLRTSPGRRI